jgi:membrane protein implicated in regulation of membrane protease activity
MTALFLASFVLGLLLAVRIMLYGVEKGGGRGEGGASATPRGSGAPDRHYRAWLPTLMVFSLVFGMVGYGVAHWSARGASIAALWALIAGAVAAMISRRMVGRWSTIVPEHDVDDPRYVLQGHPAQVVQSISPTGVGEILFEIESEQRRLPARALDDVAVGVGTEVVIERIEDGIAYVEPWLQVEQRL